jgi:hypothetical protein
MTTVFPLELQASSATHSLPGRPREHSPRLDNVPQPNGRLVALRTKAEAQAGLSLIDAYVIEVPLKGANDTLR